MTNESWHLSKAIPVSFILAIVVLFVSLITSNTTLSGEVARNKDDISALEANQGLLSQTVQNQEVTLGRIDENIKSIKEFLENAFD
jgi:hypothetical protein